MVWVPIRLGIGQNKLRPQTSEHFNHLHQGGLVDFEKAISQIQILTMHDTKNLGSSSSFQVACLSRSPGAQFSAGQIDQSNALALGDHRCNRSSCCQLHIIRMGTKSTDIHRIHLSLRHGFKVRGSQKSQHPLQ